MTYTKKFRVLKRMSRLCMRLTPSELSKIKALAEIYAGGNVTKFIVWACENAPREFIK